MSTITSLRKVASAVDVVLVADGGDQRRPAISAAATTYAQGARTFRSSSMRGISISTKRERLRLDRGSEESMHRPLNFQRTQPRPRRRLFCRSCCDKDTRTTCQESPEA